MGGLESNSNSNLSLFIGPEDGSQELRRTGDPADHGPRYIPPWTTPYVIGVGGSSGSGKTSVAAKIISSINTPWTVLISLDNFYKPLTQEQREQAFQNNFDFDEPDSIDLDLAYECIRSLKEGKKTSIPLYSFVHHNRVPGKSVTIYGSSVIVVEGIYALHDKRLLDLMDLKVFVDVDLDVCLARRLSRDIISRGRELDGCIQQWEKFVKPNAEKYVNPSMKNADVIIPSMGNNAVATQTVINHIKSRLQVKSRKHLQELRNLGHTKELKPLSEMGNVHQLEHTSQVVALKTILLDKYTPRDDFVFYFDRIASILISRALDDMPLHPQKQITTPTGIKVTAPSVHFDKVASINIVRSGDCFMRSLKKAVPGMAMGKLLIQSDSNTGEPQLHCEFLPPGLENYEQVLLADAQIISGAAVIMAIQVLLDHGVPLSKIKVLVYLATEIGIRRIVNAFSGSVTIHAGEIVATEALGTHHCKWARKRFVDSQYFGCD
ncbi:uridine kinase URK1 [Lachancea thermotolerans CBS 6340]|uniref:Uridine kinase n=1 Tax=Lachancea thermotolerans (strain ATCC 56472 / CBS 6340 / NRRL Y-8284) TaxID=559295 RepID=C5DBW8_LACTC|nr:KLTH0A05940p [Lachancea thermotolerans CBS 6340]CAR21275.1 KLTH0A05940p [Lachancea thermotolerans CBS 6340]